MNYAQKLSEQFDVREDYVANIIALLDEGNTIPFIARYRKEMHGSMDDQLIREISERLAYLRGLDERREEVRGFIAAQEKLTDEISLALDNAKTLSEIDDIYRPFRPKRKTRASVAKEKGLEPLAQLIMAQEDEKLIPIVAAEEYVDGEKGVEKSPTSSICRFLCNDRFISGFCSDPWFFNWRRVCLGQHIENRTDPCLIKIVERR